MVILLVCLYVGAAAGHRVVDEQNDDCADYGDQSKRRSWWQLPERFRSLAVYEGSHKCPENISHFLIVRL